ncbi:MAG: hypothetical protein AB7V77_05855 [Candidatus Woesearchaeota archaeon]
MEDGRVILEHDKAICDYCGLEILNEGDDLFENYLETSKGHFACAECFEKWCDNPNLQLRENWDESI